MNEENKPTADGAEAQRDILSGGKDIRKLASEKLPQRIIKPVFLAVLTPFAAKRGEAPLLNLYQHDAHIEARTSRSAVWCAVIGEAATLDEAHGIAARMLRNSEGEVTHGGRFAGFDFAAYKRSPYPESASSAKSAVKNSEGAR